MEENKHLHKDELRRSDDDQLRDLTTNETIREVTGNPETDLSRIGAGSVQNASTSARDAKDLQGTDLTQGTSYNPNDASAVRSGGTTDMDDQTAGGAGLAAGERGSSNITTRRTVTGSDFDGQDKTS